MTVYRRPDPIPLHRNRPAGEFSLRRVKAEQEDLHHLVSRQIFVAINSGAYPEGSVLPTEEALSEELGVSRTALREAIKGLASKGMLETRRRRGTLVLDRSNWNLLDAEVLAWLRRDDSRIVSEQLWQTVVALVPSLAGIAAQRGPTTQLSATRDTNHNHDVAARAEFLLALARAAGNRFAYSVVAAALRSLVMSDREFLERATREVTSDAVQSVLSAIIVFDSEGAHRAVTRALRSQLEAVAV